MWIVVQKISGIKNITQKWLPDDFYFLSMATYNYEKLFKYFFNI